MVRLDCPNCDTSVSGVYALPELARLSSADQEFATAFVLSGGSLKEMAKRYRVSYPTVRNRLDDLIARVRGIHETGAGNVTEEGDQADVATGNDADPMAV